VHLVLVTKYRKQILKGAIADDIKQKIYDICNSEGYGIIAMETDKDHIHFLISYDTTDRVCDIVKLIKQKKTYYIWQKYPVYLSKCYWKYKIFWSDGYFACSIGEASFDNKLNSSVTVSDFDLIIGERVIQNVNGSGTVSDVIYDDDGKIKKFTVLFDSGSEKQYLFPAAFAGGMKLESGEEVPIYHEISPAVSPKPAAAPVKKPEKKKKITGKDTYASWADRYPNHVIIKKEGVFWTTRGESAEMLNKILGYKLGGKPGNYMTGSPVIEPIVYGLSSHEINYIVIEDGEIVDQADFD
jgi:putative transposase